LTYHLGTRFDEHVDDALPLFITWLENFEYTTWGSKVIETISFILCSCTPQRTLPFKDKVLLKMIDAGNNIQKFPLASQQIILNALERVFRSDKLGMIYHKKKFNSSLRCKISIFGKCFANILRCYC
jgi:hypothetical protein